MHITMPAWPGIE